MGMAVNEKIKDLEEGDTKRCDHCLPDHPSINVHVFECKSIHIFSVANITDN